MLTESIKESSQLNLIKELEREKKISELREKKNSLPLRDQKGRKKINGAIYYLINGAIMRARAKERRKGKEQETALKFRNYYKINGEKIKSDRRKRYKKGLKIPENLIEGEDFFMIPDYAQEKIIFLTKEEFQKKSVPEPLEMEQIQKKLIESLA